MSMANSSQGGQGAEQPLGPDQSAPGGSGEQGYVPAGMTISKKIKHYKGLTPEEFLRRFKLSPKQMGLQLRELHRPDGSKYKGVLIVDDGSLEGVGQSYMFYEEVNPR